MPHPDRYASLARWYDLTASTALRSAHEGIVDVCSRRGFQRVLDVGCGTGRLCRMLQKRGIHATGLDASPAMLARAASFGGFSVPLVLGGMPLPFAASSFNAVILSMVLHESDAEAEAILADALRIASLCIVLEWRMPERNLDYIFQPLVHAIERLAGREHYMRFRHFASGGYLHGAAMRAGARVTGEEPLKCGTLVLAEVGR